MKSVLLVVLAIAIFPTDSRGFPDKPDKRNFAVYHNDKNFHDGSGSNHSSTDGDLAIYTASLLFPNGSQGLNFSEVVQQSLEERKEGYDEPLRATCNDRWWCRNKNLCNQWWYPKYCPKSCNLCTDPDTFTFYPSPKLSWNDAFKKCLSENSKLAILIDPTKFHTFMKDKYPGHQFWLGGTDLKLFQSVHWRWIDGTPIAADFPWPPHQPDNAYGNEDCLEWGHLNNFNDANCNSKKGFVCMK